MRLREAPVRYRDGSTCELSRQTSVMEGDDQHGDIGAEHDVCYVHVMLTQNNAIAIRATISFVHS